MPKRSSYLKPSGGHAGQAGHHKAGCDGAGVAVGDVQDHQLAKSQANLMSPIWSPTKDAESEAKHNWEKYYIKKAANKKHQNAQDSLKTWIDNEKRLEKEIARMTAEAAEAAEAAEQ